VLRRWDGRVYDNGLVMGILDLVLESMELESRIKGKKDRKPRRPAGLYVTSV